MTTPTNNQVAQLPEGKDWYNFLSRYENLLVQCGLIVSADNLDYDRLAEARGIEKGRQMERERAANIVEEMMEDSEHWQPIAGRILGRTIINKSEITPPQEDHFGDEHKMTQTHT